MPKPQPPQTALPLAPSIGPDVSHLPDTVSVSLPANSTAMPAGWGVPFGPDGRPYSPKANAAAVVGGLPGWKSPDVLCPKCVHSHFVVSAANVNNTDEDGRRFVDVRANCFRYGNPPVSLDELRPIECNQFQQKEPK